MDGLMMTEWPYTASSRDALCCTVQLEHPLQPPDFPRPSRCPHLFLGHRKSFNPIHPLNSVHKYNLLGTSLHLGIISKSGNVLPYCIKIF